MLRAPPPTTCSPDPTPTTGSAKSPWKPWAACTPTATAWTSSALRIGYCGPHPLGRHGLATWLSPDDCANLVEACLRASGIRVVWGVSDNTRRWSSLDEARALGYTPRDDAEVFADKWEGDAPEEDLDPEGPTVGGLFCEPDLDADRLT